MIALTQRLVERDEQIMALQDELDEYDRHQKELEEMGDLFKAGKKNPPISKNMVYVCMRSKQVGRGES
jgi:hypothetical protein